MSFAEREWKNLKVEGRSDFVLMEKLRIFKIFLRKWERDCFNILDLNIDEGIRVINESDSMLES